MGQSLLGASWGAGVGTLVLGDPADFAGVWERVWGNLRIRGGGPSSHRIPSDGDGARPGCGGTLSSWGAWSCVGDTREPWEGLEQESGVGHTWCHSKMDL